LVSINPLATTIRLSRPSRKYGTCHFQNCARPSRSMQAWLLEPRAHLPNVKNCAPTVRFDRPRHAEGRGHLG
jgi:hypothetical protein